MKKLVLAVLFSGAAFTAYANDAHKKPNAKEEAAFKALDKDGDGTISEAEASADAKLSEAVKADKDKKFTASDYSAFVEHKH